MEPELEELAASGAAVLVRTMDTRAVRNRFLELFQRAQSTGELGLKLIGSRIQLMEAGEDDGALAGIEAQWRDRLTTLLREDPEGLDLAFGLRDIVADFAPRKNPQPPAEVRNTISGGTIDTVVQAGAVSRVTVHAADSHDGDHVDFQNGTFHDRVVGVQHNHYPARSFGDPPAPRDWPWANEISPAEVGVRPSRRVPGLPDIPWYTARDADTELGAQLAWGGLVLILGKRVSGKSYTAWKGLQGLRGWRVYAPERGADLRSLPALIKARPGRYVVWLDELDGHLGTGGLEPGLLGRLTGLGVVVLATMDVDEYYERRRGSSPGDRVVATARTTELPRAWSRDELDRLAEHTEDPRLYEAFLWCGDEGAAAYLAVGHLLCEEWRREVHQAACPGGQLLVRIAVDLARCGITRAVPRHHLEELAADYDPLRRPARDESLDAALDWATAPQYGVTGLLIAGEEPGTLRAYGALAAEGLRSAELPPVPESVLWTLLEEGVERYEWVDQAALRAVMCAAFRPRADAGDTHAMKSLAELGDDEDPAQADAWYRRAVDAGDPEAAEALGLRLLQRGDETAALRYLEMAAEGGWPESAAELGRILRDRAEHWLRTAAEADHGEAAHRLGDMLVGTGQTAEAMRWYRRAAEGGHEAVAASLGSLLHDWHELAEAELWYRRGVAAGDDRAAHNLALLLHNQGGRDEEAERLYRLAEAAGHATASLNLGILLERQGNVEQAQIHYRQAHDRGDYDGGYRLALLLREAGRTQEAAEWFRKAAELGSQEARKALAEPDTKPDAEEGAGRAPANVKE
ncbi:tetratricopeptide repeat protein [Streptomyces sp. E11-3]|uniref:hypothetical protein n=1 Tax=Streptomyces sp. E11-3 TaxID=3110112 RepID=UPI00398043ED